MILNKAFFNGKESLFCFQSKCSGSDATPYNNRVLNHFRQMLILCFNACIARNL